MVSATLETDEDNPTQAAHFYQQLGFREVWRWLAYGKDIARHTQAVPPTAEHSR
jgi:ribosomal protein S18 acetylase RimI-like enzyme